MHTIADLTSKSDADLQALKQTTTGISLATLNKWRSTTALPGTSPGETIDYRTFPNPYLEKYGADNWERKVSESIFMKKYMSIRTLVKEIHDSSKAAFVNTVHADDWYFYHDALSQMTAKSTVEWMKTEGYYKRWLIPQKGCNAGTVYANRPVGNSPEFMPLDNSLNQDIQVSLSLHCAITAHLPDADSRKFSMRTPKTIVEGIDKIWGAEGDIPNSKRIMHDCDKALNAFGVVYRAGGYMVPELAN